MANRSRLKARVLGLLSQSDPALAERELAAEEPAALFGALFSAMLHPEPLVGWRAVTAFGWTAARLAARDMESARILMRRLMWSLNEESGAVGWGAAEAMGETLARVPALAREYHRILASYVHEGEKEGNFLDHAPLRRGAYWALARLAQAGPDLAAPAAQDLAAALADPDPAIRGLAALGLGRLSNALPVGAREALQGLAGDDAEFDLYGGWSLRRVRVGDLARRATASG